MSTNHKKLNSRKKELILEALYAGVKSMPQDNSVEYFINTLLTESEKITIGRRILIAQMILAGKTQAEIRYILGVSPNTFTRTRKWLNKQIPHYDDAIKKHAVEQMARAVKRNGTRKKYIDPLSFTGLRKKFPMHFLLFNVAEELIVKLSK
ncbi:MAG: Trp operon repressor [Acidimicrobiales bacterium]|jgi:Trp operon repressor